MTPTSILLARLDGEITQEEISEGISKWLHADVPLATALGLPATPAEARRAIRDAWLVQAGQRIPAASLYARACSLALAAGEFERRKWPLWKHYLGPPPRASEIDLCLYYAVRSRAALPSSPRQFVNILGNAGPLEFQDSSATMPEPTTEAKKDKR